MPRTYNLYTPEIHAYILANARKMTDSQLARNLTLITGLPFSPNSIRRFRQVYGIWKKKKMRG